MTWIFYALGAPVLWAMVNIADQYLVTKHAKGEHPAGALVLFSSLVGLVVSFGIGLFVKGVFNVPFGDISILLVSGLLTALWIIFYLRAIELDDISHVVVWFYSIPVFSFLLGYLILGETLSTKQLLGGLIIILGGVIHSIDFTKEKARKSARMKATISMLIACFLVGVSSVMFKLVTNEHSFWISSFWQYLGLGITGVLFYLFVPRYQKSFVNMIKNDGPKILRLNIVSEFVTVVANLMNTFATLLVPITLVYFVNYSFQPVIVLLFAVLGTKFAPHIIKEEFTKHTLIPKLASIAVMIAGTYFIFN